MRSALLRLGVDRELNARFPPRRAAHRRAAGPDRRGAGPVLSFSREAAANVPGQITSSRNWHGPVSQGDRP